MLSHSSTSLLYPPELSTSLGTTKHSLLEAVASLRTNAALDIINSNHHIRYIAMRHVCDINRHHTYMMCAIGMERIVVELIGRLPAVGKCALRVESSLREHMSDNVLQKFDSQRMKLNLPR